MNSREIGFRAWIKAHNKMVEVWQLNYKGFDGQELESIGSSLVINQNYIFFIEDVILMQYTGLKDKNKKKIYEGDILTFDPLEWNKRSFKPKSEWEYPTWVVEWNEKDAEWSLGGGLNNETPVFKEVIGNIYEHPHLLNQSE